MSITQINKQINQPISLTGGIVLEEHKVLSSESELQICPLPEYLFLPLTMHSGLSANTIVKKGDTVVKGQLLAEAEADYSAAVHSPVDGVIADIKKCSVVNRSGLDEDVIVVKCETTQTEDSKAYSARRLDNWREKSSKDLLSTIKQAGIVGLGGAGFPTSLKITASIDKIHTLLINGAECEPYISCDDRLMRDYSEALIEGGLIVSKILNCSNITIAIEDNKQTALRKMSEAVSLIKEDKLDIKVVEIPTIYPSGGEKQLLEIITSEQVPKGQFPAALGYIVQNVGTVLAIYDAVVKGKPLSDRIVTVTGNAISRPGNYRVTLGTPIQHLLKHTGWDKSITTTLIHGGPMMGYPLSSPDKPVVKITNCIIAGTKDEFPSPSEQRACIRCGKCADVCPASLLPQQLFWFSQAGELNKAEDYNLMDCIECGACAYVCPSQIPLVEYYRFTKGEIKTRSVITDKADRSKLRFDFRNQRIEDLKQEKIRLREERAKRNAANKNKSDDGDPKKKAVAEALARVQQKKKAQQEANSVKDNPDDS